MTVLAAHFLATFGATIIKAFHKEIEMVSSYFRAGPFNLWL
jgi:hypothetical protein